MNANGTNAIPSRSQNPYNTTHQQNVGVEAHSLPQNDQAQRMFMPRPGLIRFKNLKITIVYLDKILH